MFPCGFVNGEEKSGKEMLTRPKCQTVPAMIPVNAERFNSFISPPVLYEGKKKINAGIFWNECQTDLTAEQYILKFKYKKGSLNNELLQ